MHERFNQESASSTSRIENRFTELRIRDGDHEPYDWTRCVKFAGIPGGVTHFAKHRFIERTERVQFFARTEMEFRGLCNHIAQEITIDHAIDRAFEHGRNHIASIAAVSSGQTPQISKQTRSA